MVCKLHVFLIQYKVWPWRANYRSVRFISPECTQNQLDETIGCDGEFGGWVGFSGICWTSQNARCLRRSRPDIKHVRYRKRSLVDISSATVFVGSRLTSALNTQQFVGRWATEANHNTLYISETDSASAPGSVQSSRRAQSQVQWNL